MLYQGYEYKKNSSACVKQPVPKITWWSQLQTQISTLSNSRFTSIHPLHTAALNGEKQGILKLSILETYNYIAIKTYMHRKTNVNYKQTTNKIANKNSQADMQSDIAGPKLNHLNKFIRSKPSKSELWSSSLKLQKQERPGSHTRELLTDHSSTL